MAKQQKIKTVNKTYVDKNHLTLDELLQETDKYDELVKIEFENGTYTYVYKFFSPTKIDAMLDDFGKFIDAYTKKINKPTEKKILNYLNIHILLHFSQLTDKLDYTLEEKVTVFDKILKSETAELIIESFDKKEIEKIYTRFWKLLEVYQEMIKTNKEMQSRLREEIEKSDMDNKDIIMNVMFPSNNAEIVDSEIENRNVQDH